MSTRSRLDVARLGLSAVASVARALGQDSIADVAELALRQSEETPSSVARRDADSARKRSGKRAEYGAESARNATGIRADVEGVGGGMSTDPERDHDLLTSSHRGSAEGEANGIRSESARNPQLAWERDPLGSELLGLAWAEGVKLGRGTPVTTPTKGVWPSLVAAVKTHAPPALHAGHRQGPRADWVRERAAAWARTSPRKVTVFEWIAWLDSGAPAQVDKYGKPVAHAAAEKPYYTMSERAPHAEAISQEEYDSAPAVWAPQIAKGKFYIFNPRAAEAEEQST